MTPAARRSTSFIAARRALHHHRAERRLADVVWYLTERALSALVRPGPTHRLVGLFDRPVRWNDPPLPATRHRHGHCMTRCKMDELASMEAAYLEDLDTAEPERFLVRLDRLVELPARDPAWSPYATAVRGRALTRLCAERLGTMTATERRRIGRHAALHLFALVVRSERHLHNNHRTTIEFTKFVLARLLGFRRLEARSADRFLRHA